jgi:membrane-associated protein
MMLGGYYLQTWVEKQYDFSLKDHIEAITLVIITITTIPVMYKLFFAKKKVIPSDSDTNN